MADRSDMEDILTQLDRIEGKMDDLKERSEERERAERVARTEFYALVCFLIILGYAGWVLSE